LKITQSEVIDRQTVLSIELEEPDLPPYIDAGYRKVVNRLNIPGFRKGKAPLSIVERYLGKEGLLNEALDYMVSDMTQKAIDAQSLEASGTPKLEVVDLDPVTVKATVPLEPGVDITGYESIRVEEKPSEVNESDIDERLAELQKHYATWEPAERPVKLGDMVTLDVQGSVETNEILNERDAVFLADKDRGVPFPGFAEQLEGIEIGGTKDFVLKVPDDYADAEIKGKEANFKVSVSGVKERKFPELNDDFAKEIGEKYDGLQALKDEIRSGIEADAKKASESQYREAALVELVKLARVELPPLLVEHEVEHMVDRRNQLIDRMKVRLDDYLRYLGKTEEQVQEEMKKDASDQLTRSYALAKLGDVEKIDVADDELDAKLAELENVEDEHGHKVTRKQLKSERIRGQIRESLRMDKTMKRLIEIAKGQNGAAPAQ